MLFLDPSLRHHAGEPSSSIGPLGALIDAAERAFAMLLADDSAIAQDALDEIARRLDAMAWLEGDLVHDELRHRRAPAPDAPAASSTAAPEPELVAVRAERGRESTGGSRPGCSPHPRQRIVRRGLYRQAYPDVEGSGLDPIGHYLTIGAREGRNPAPLFDTAYYARQMARRRAPAAGSR